MAYQKGCDVRGCSTFELMTTVTLWIEHLEYKTARLHVDKATTKTTTTTTIMTYDQHNHNKNMFMLMTTVTMWIEHLEYKTARPDRMHLEWHKSCSRGKMYQIHRFELSNRSLGWKLKQSEQMVVAWTQKERDLTQVYSYSETIWISVYDDFLNHTLMSNNPGLVMDTIYHRKKVVFQRLNWHSEYLLKVTTHSI